MSIQLQESYYSFYAVQQWAGHTVKTHFTYAISNALLILRRPTVSRPHSENTFHVRLWRWSWKQVFIKRKYSCKRPVYWTKNQPVPPASAASVRYLAICVAAVSAFWPVDAKLRSWAIIFEDKKRKRLKAEEDAVCSPLLSAGTA